MSDRLTQLQTCLDQLLDIFGGGLAYVDAHHAVVPLADGDPAMEEKDHPADTPAAFSEALQELARDAIIKTRQILTTIDTLPGVGVSETAQMATIAGLKNDLRDAELAQNAAIESKEALQEYLNGLILRIASDLSTSK